MLLCSPKLNHFDYVKKTSYLIASFVAIFSYCVLQHCFIFEDLLMNAGTKYNFLDLVSNSGSNLNCLDFDIV